MARWKAAKSRLVLGLPLAFSLATLACGSEAPGSGPAQAAMEKTVVELAKRGRAVYQANCTACHNNDPSQKGAVGPALAGSSLELLRTKVLRNEYPPGYTPKQATGQMVALPHLEPDLPALAAYLAGPAGS
jgi:mono/diheme cytochrome c family protein